MFSKTSISFRMVSPHWVYYTLKSKQERHKFRCSFSTKYDFPSFWFSVIEFQNSMDSASRTQVNIFKLFWPSYKFLQAHSFTNCLIQTCLMRALVSKKRGYYPLDMFRYKAARTFDLSLMKGAVFKSYSYLFHTLIAELLLSCSNLEVVKGSFLWSFSVQSAKQWGLIKWTLMCSLSTRRIVDLAFTSKGQWIEELLNLLKLSQLSFSYLSPF